MLHDKLIHAKPLGCPANDERVNILTMEIGFPKVIAKIVRSYEVDVLYELCNGDITVVKWLLPLLPFCDIWKVLARNNRPDVFNYVCSYYNFDQYESMLENIMDDRLSDPICQSIITGLGDLCVDAEESGAYSKAIQIVSRFAKIAGVSSLFHPGSYSRIHLRMALTINILEVKRTERFDAPADGRDWASYCLVSDVDLKRVRKIAISKDLRPPISEEYANQLIIYHGNSERQALHNAIAVRLFPSDEKLLLILQIGISDILASNWVVCVAEDAKEHPPADVRDKKELIAFFRLEVGNHDGFKFSWCLCWLSSCLLSPSFLGALGSIPKTQFTKEKTSEDGQDKNDVMHTTAS